MLVTQTERDGDGWNEKRLVGSRKHKFLEKDKPFFFFKKEEPLES